MESCVVDLSAENVMITVRSGTCAEVFSYFIYLSNRERTIRNLHNQKLLETRNESTDIKGKFENIKFV